MSDSKLEQVQAKTRRRLLFTAIHLVLYFSFTLNWTTWGKALTGPVGNGPLSGSILMFVILVVTFIALEVLFLAVDKAITKKALEQN